MSYPILKRPILCRDDEILHMKMKMGNALNEKMSIWDLDYKKISLTALGVLAFVGAVFCFVNVALGTSGAFIFFGLSLSSFSIYLSGKAVNRISLKRKDHRALVIDSLRKKTFVEVVKSGYSKDQIVSYKLLGEDPRVYVVFEKMMLSYRSCMQMSSEYEKEYTKTFEYEMQPFDLEIQKLNGRMAVVLSLQEKRGLLGQRTEVEKRKEEMKDFLNHIRKECLEAIKAYSSDRIKYFNDFFQEVRER